MTYQLGQKVSDEGIWKDFSGARLKIGRAGSVEFLRAVESLEKPYRKKIARDSLSVTVKRDLNLRALARAVLLDWDGVLDSEGKTIAYTEDLGTSALGNDPDLLEFVMDISLDNENFAIERVTDIAKKSSKRSTG